MTEPTRAGVASIHDGDWAEGRKVLEPATEILSIADYRLRYACYRADPDLQRLHQMAPMVAFWDDHESSNDSWEGGAQNHQPAKEGDWNIRRAAAMQVYREWMPVSEEPWKAYPIGTLATLYRTESRLLARTQQADIGAAFRASDPDAALKAFRDGAWRDPSATMLGSTQESWLARSRATRAIAVRAASSQSMVRKAARSAASSPGRTKIPPPSSNSGNGLDVVAITAAPQAAASTAGNPYPSLADGRTRATAPLCK